MKQGIYMHAKSIRDSWLTLDLEQFNLTHHYLNTFELTQSISRYDGIIRKLSYIMDVVALKNEFDYSEGIYVVGYESFVVEYIKILKNIIIKVEKQTSKVKKNAYNKKLHLAEAKSNFKSKCISIYEKALDEKLKNPLETNTKKIINEYISQIPSLKSKKQIRW